jgi:type I restriction enzyme, R subunit
MAFNEDSRVKIPAILHLTRLGYSYLPLKDHFWDSETNIFPAVLRDSLARINPEATPDDIDRTFQEINLQLDNEDLGKAFHERLLRADGIRLIDFEDFNNNSFHVVTELPCKNGDDEFRPDVTLLINGMPLFFMEVKKPNNRDGILAERNRINRRFKNPKFRKFVNITQLMVFSNNMEYAEDSPEPLEGAFYATTCHADPSFNYFREEEKRDFSQILATEDPETENLILADNNLTGIRHSAEYATNKNPESPTNRLSLSQLAATRGEGRSSSFCLRLVSTVVGNGGLAC